MSAHACVKIIVLLLASLQALRPQGVSEQRQDQGVHQELVQLHLQRFGFLRSQTQRPAQGAAAPFFSMAAAGAVAAGAILVEYIS